MIKPGHSPIDATDDAEEAPAGAADTFDVHRYLCVLRARKWPLIGMFALVFLASTLKMLSETPVYRASCLLLIEPRKPQLMNVQDVYDPLTAGGLQDYYTTQFEILKSRRVAERVVEALKLREREGFRELKDPAAALMGMVRVEPVRESRLVRVSVESTDRSFAALAANAVVEQYIDEQNSRTLGVSDRGLRTLREMAQALRPKYETAAHALQKFKEDEGLLAIDEYQSIAAQQVRFLTDELVRARATRLKAEAEKRAVEDALGRGVPADTLAALADSKRFELLSSSLLKLEQERDELSRHFGPDHPQAQAMEKRIARTRRDLESAVKAEVTRLDNDLAAAVALEKETQAALVAAEAKFGEIGRKGIRLQLLKEEYETLSGSHKNTARRIEEVEMTLATGARDNNLSIVDRALEPDAPFAPQKPRRLALGALLGLFSGIGLCLLLELLDNTVKGKDEVERLLGYPVLGFVPRVDSPATTALGNGNGNGKGHGPLPIELASVADPSSHVAEAFRTIRTSLGFTLPAHESKALVVTSASPRDGKTFASVNLACSIARTGKRVLLVEADLRQPRFGELFHLPPGPGLSVALAGGSTPMLGAARVTDVGGLDVLPAGVVPPNPAELLGGEGVKTLLEEALAAYDWVIFDAPPVGTVADTAILLSSVRHVLFVSRAFATVKGQARHAKEVLAKTPARVAGVVLNMVDAPPGAAHGYGDYGYGYGYGGNGSNRALAARVAPDGTHPTNRIAI